jgi:hypothetical protein
MTYGRPSKHSGSAAKMANSNPLPLDEAEIQQARLKALQREWETLERRQASLDQQQQLLWKEKLRNLQENALLQGSLLLQSRPGTPFPST